MEYIQHAIDIFLHLDKYLEVIIKDYGLLTYVILFIVIFAETGLVVTPFLPGDSLLFAAGTFTANEAMGLNPIFMFILLTIAAVLGDAVNYTIGHFIGPKVFEKEKIKFLKKEHLEKTHQFYEKYGGKTIIIARFVPIVRTFAPFVAGIGKMTYAKFALYNVTGAILWVGMFVFGGYFFGNFEIVRKNYSLVVVAIVVISVLPGVYEFLKHRSQQKNLKGLK